MSDLPPQTDSTYDEYLDEARQLLREDEKNHDRLRELVTEWSEYGLEAEHGDLVDLALGLNREEG